jgi:hypothetical protein
MVEVGGERNVTEIAEYIRGMAKELEALASRADLGFLAYLLSMVQQEAQREATGQPPPARNV